MFTPPSPLLSVLYFFFIGYLSAFFSFFFFLHPLRFTPPLSTTTVTTIRTYMADSKGAAPASAGWRKYAFLNLTPAQYFVRLIPAIVYGFYMYSTRGPFQPASCTSFGLSCPMTTNHIAGVLERPEYYGQVLGYYTDLIAKSEDLGGSLAVFVDGQPVIDVYTGFKDLARTQAYDNTTLQQVYSSGKAVEGIIIARLVDQGKLDYEAKIVEYWPEFGQNGKEEVRLRDLMVHESGVPALDDEDKLDALSWASQGDEEKFSARLARQPHVFGGKPTRAYHAITRGWFLNEIVKRVDPKGRTIGQIAQQDLMTNYEDLELYYSKLPKETDWEERLSPMHDYPLLRLLGRLVLPQVVQNSKVFGSPRTLPLHWIVKKSFESKSITARALTPKFAPWPRLFRTPEAHVHEGTSFSLKTNAHSVSVSVRLCSLNCSPLASFTSSFLRSFPTFPFSISDSEGSSFFQMSFIVEIV